MQIGVITNPNSHKNMNRPHRAQELQSIVGSLGQVHATQSPEEIKPVLREFLRNRARFWVSDGGDGALHWMLRFGLDVVEEEAAKGEPVSLPLALPTNGGSIDFVAHNVGIRGDAKSILKRLREDLEEGRQIEEVEVDSMLIEGVQEKDGQEVPFRTLGFGVAAGGVGQRFFDKLEEAGQHTSRNIIEIVAKTVASFPVAMSPLRHLPGMPKVLRQFARDMFNPTVCRVTIDGEEIPYEDFTGIHIASMSLNLGGVLRFFSKADVPGQLHCIVGSPSPFCIIRNVPRMHFGMKMKGDSLVDGPCKTMTMEATGDELMAPVIDGEYYQNVKKISFKPGPRVTIPKIVGRKPRGVQMLEKLEKLGQPLFSLRRWKKGPRFTN